jgi:hypothetical protein
MIEKPTILTIESHSKKFSAELPWDTSIYDLMGAMKGLLVASGWPIELINELIKLEDE